MPFPSTSNTSGHSSGLPSLSLLNKMLQTGTSLKARNPGIQGYSVVSFSKSSYSTFMLGYSNTMSAATAFCSFVLLQLISIAATRLRVVLSVLSRSSTQSNLSSSISYSLSLFYSASHSCLIESSTRVWSLSCLEMQGSSAPAPLCLCSSDVDSIRLIIKEINCCDQVIKGPNQYTSQQLFQIHELYKNKY
ncbi:hypothetical protein FGO68_gene5484 [Halteria grandinella]|uniref:Uncharacterized protein n=1 Tax=Halteria grandinella TaxID=5974 RepID=A0A8J8NDE4_HALGN|nr:hypothetical protein FGO68_gene5484 [Halteria grandinella]